MFTIVLVVVVVVMVVMMMLLIYSLVTRVFIILFIFKFIIVFTFRSFIIYRIKLTGKGLASSLLLHTSTESFKVVALFAPSFELFVISSSFFRHL